MKKLTFLILFSLTILPGLKLSEVKASHKDYATQRQKQDMNITKGTSPALVPGFATDRPPEAGLNHPESLKAATERVFHSNPIAADLKQSAETRPYFVLDPHKDPIVANSQAAIHNSENVLGDQLHNKSLGAAYVYKTCLEYKAPLEFKCSKDLIPPTMHIDPAKYSHFWCRMNNHRPDDPICGAKTYYPVARMYEPERVSISPEAWSSNCGSMDTKDLKCRLIKETCPKGAETRIIIATQGPERIPVQRSVTRNCWRYEYTYECAHGFSTACASFRNSTCEQMGSKCLQKKAGECIEWEQTYRCPTGRAPTQEQISKRGYVAPQGESGVSATPNADMPEAIARLAVLKDIQDIMRANDKLKDTSGLQIFKGNDRRCTIAFGGFKNCCVKKGWGLSMGLSHCKSEEKDLAERQKRKLCVKIGTYCAKKVLGKCIHKKTSYCCFPTKLSRLIQEQGRGQLNMGWGKPKHPECRGFTVDELSRLDFEKLDLSELFDEIFTKIKKVNQSTVNTVSRNLSNRVSQMGQEFNSETKTLGIQSPGIQTQKLKSESNKPLSGEF
jgi:hypothetical protein